MTVGADDGGVKRAPVTRPTVLLDCDGVLADFVGGYLKLLGATTDRWFSSAQVTHFDIGASLGLTPAEAACVKREISARRGFCDALEVLPGAAEGVRALRDVTEVYIITSPWNSCPTWTYEREAWLKRHFDIPSRNVLHGAAKHLVAGDVFIDDKTSAVIAWQAAHPNGVAIQWHTPHNRLDGFDGLSTNNWRAVRESAVERRFPTWADLRGSLSGGVA